MNTIISSRNMPMSFVMLTVVSHFLFSNLTSTFSPAKDLQIHFCISENSPLIKCCKKEEKKKEELGTTYYHLNIVLMLH